jgi:hypothetical protein
MAAYTAATAKSQTLGAGVLDSVALSDSGRSIEVFNLSATNPIYFRTGATVADIVNPTVAGDNCTVVAPNSSTKVAYPTTASGLNGCAVKLISTGAQAYTVQINDSERIV